MNRTEAGMQSDEQQINPQRKKKTTIEVNPNDTVPGSLRATKANGLSSWIEFGIVTDASSEQQRTIACVMKLTTYESILLNRSFSGSISTSTMPV
jgi:hypothetical protein